MCSRLRIGISYDSIQLIINLLYFRKILPDTIATFTCFFFERDRFESYFELVFCWLNYFKGLRIKLDLNIF